MIQERPFIAAIQQLPQPQGQDLLTAIGDDCAVIAQGQHQALLLTTDTLVEGVHFDLAFHHPHLLGRKVAAVNISDIAAMGGIPRYAQLSVALPPTLTKKQLDDFMAGFLACCQEYGIILSGGDTVTAPQATFTVTLVGEMAQHQVCRRTGGQPDDEIWVSGDLGNAAAGLILLQQGHGQQPEFAPLCAAHLNPVPQVPLGRLLAQSGQITAMLDISDGLATDLAHLCQASHLGARVQESSLPLAPALTIAARLCQTDPIAWAVNGGEDYQLLYTVSAKHGRNLATRIKKELGITVTNIGHLQNKSGVHLLSATGSREISYQGYEHGT